MSEVPLYKKPDVLIAAALIAVIISTCFSKPVEINAGQANSSATITKGDVLILLLKEAWRTSDPSYNPNSQQYIQPSQDGGNTSQIPVIQNNPQMIQPQANIIENGSPVYYTIQSGDTLYSIANRYATSLQYLMQLNGIQDPNLILAGATIRVR